MLQFFAIDTQSAFSYILGTSHTNNYLELSTEANHL